MSELDWIAVDWGTSSLRVWGIDVAGQVMFRAATEEGMGQIAQDGYEAALLRLVAPHVAGPVDVLICGMAGSRQGWAEAPYAAAPCAPPRLADAVKVATRDPRLSVRILPGIKQVSPADVMRGEETQIAGFMAVNPRFDGVICLPGTHTKWVQVSAGEVVSFQTFMTGEMFAALSAHTVLQHSVTGGAWDADAFQEAVADAISRPDKQAARFFSLRAEGLLAGLAPGAARARLSGGLIGMELAGARPYWLGQAVAIIGADTLAQAYRDALDAQGVPAVLADTERMTLEGLKAARQPEKELTS